SRRRHTRSKRDWSSDVCSSDLERETCGAAARPLKSCSSPFSRTFQIFGRFFLMSSQSLATYPAWKRVLFSDFMLSRGKAQRIAEIGRASCREGGRPAPLVRHNR